MLDSKELLYYTRNLNLLFVEEHLELRKNLTEILKKFFHNVKAVPNAKEALKLYKLNSYDIILTDIYIPHTDGISFIEKIYTLNPKQSIIILSAHKEASYLIPLINLGVSHFIQKPLDYQELFEGLYKVSKSFHIEEENSIQRSYIIPLRYEYCYDRSKRVLLNAGKSIYLTKYEIIFLDLLTSQNRKIFSTKDIVTYYNEHEEKIDAKNIRKLVSKLRKKIPAETIESVYGVGYRVISKA